MPDVVSATQEDILLDALVQIIQQNADRYGIYLDGVSGVDVQSLVEQVGGPGEVYVSLVGYEDGEALAIWAHERGWDELGFGLGMTHATKVRNEAPAEKMKLALVLEESERAHSLTERGYLRIGAAEVMREVAHLGRDRAANDPHRHLWDALTQPEVAATLSLADVLAYAAEITSASDPRSAPRDALPQLGLLPDPELFTKRSAAAIAGRLVQNRALVERLLRADPDDKLKAFATLEAADDLERDELQNAYAALLRLNHGDVDALADLSFTLVQRLLRKAKSSPPPPTYDPPPPPQEVNEPDSVSDEEDDLEEEPDEDEDLESANLSDPTQAAVSLAAEGNPELIADLAEQAEAHLEETDAEEKTLNVNGRTVPFHPDARALSLARAFVSETRFGGTLHTEDTLDDTLDDLSPLLDAADLIGEREIQELLLWMARFEDAEPEFTGRSHLQDYLDRRAALLPHLDLLATDPHLAFAGLDDVREAAESAVAAYVRLLSHLKEQFPALQSVSRDAAKDVVDWVVKLDLAVIYGETPAAVVLPTNPLTLWKHLELAGLVRQRAGTLSSEDLDLLRDDLRDFPEPLLALYVPGTAEQEPVEMAHVGRIGPLSLYSPTAIQTADVGRESIEDAARRLAMLYPPARQRLRVALLDPESLRPLAAALRRGKSGGLLQGRDPFGHVDVHVIVSGEGRLPEVGKEFGEIHGQGLVTLRQDVVRHPDDAAKLLAERPVHLLVVSGRRQTNVGSVARETTRLHPLAVPHRLIADPIKHEVRLEPRSVRAEDAAESHPYGSYADVVGALLNRRQDPAHIDRRLSRELDFTALAEHAQFCLVAGAGDSRTNDKLLYLAQRGPHADEVFTRHDDRIVSEIERLLRGWNYEPHPEGLRTLLDRLEELGGEGLFATFSDKERGGLAQKKLREKVGLAVALDWYRQQAEGGQYVVLSLDGPPARAWLGRRPDGRRADLLGFRQGSDGRVVADVIEVKSYQATGEKAADDPPADQLRAVARVLQGIFDGSGDLFHDRRRELLRRQVFLDGLLARPNPAPEWVRALNDALDGDPDTEVEVNLLLIELALEAPSGVVERQFEPTVTDDADDAARLPLRRVRLGEAAIQPFLDGLLRRPTRPGTQAALAANTQTEDQPTMPPAEPEPAPSVMPEEAAAAESNVEPTVAGPQPEPAPEPAPSEADRTRSGYEPDDEEREAIRQKAGALYRTLQNYDVKTDPIDADLADVGPTIVRFKVRLRPGEQVGKIRRIAEELMRELALEKEPIVGNLPGTTFVHVDLPRAQRHAAPLLPVLDRTTPDEIPVCTIPAGLTPDGRVEWLDLTSLPHMLVAGATQSGKSMFLYTLIGSLATLNSPDRLHLVLVDPKRTDFGFFRRLPHLHGRGVITDPAEAVAALTDLIDGEMERRTDLLEEEMYLNVHSYNDDHPGAPIPLIVVVIDEFADLADVMDSREQRETFDLALRRLAQRARSVGIHLVIATQRPTADIINGTIKANLPGRVSFRLGSGVDSRTILDEGGAEHLFGRGDMLLKAGDQTSRLQGFFLDESDLRTLVRAVSR